MIRTEIIRDEERILLMLRGDGLSVVVGQDLS